MLNCYVVRNEHTLGYMIDAVNMGVLRASVLRGAPFALHPGPQHVAFSNLRPATVEDFATYRVQVPPDFDEAANAALMAEVGI